MMTTSEFAKRHVWNKTRTRAKPERDKSVSMSSPLPYFYMDQDIFSFVNPDDLRHIYRDESQVTPNFYADTSWDSNRQHATACPAQQPLPQPQPLAQCPSGTDS